MTAILPALVSLAGLVILAVTAYSVNRAFDADLKAVSK